MTASESNMLPAHTGWVHAETCSAAWNVRTLIGRVRFQAELRRRTCRSIKPPPSRPGRLCIDHQPTLQVASTRSSLTSPHTDRIESLSRPQSQVAFTCPFCNHPNAVACHINLKERFAMASCRNCSDKYFTTANALTEPVDVYSEWIDAYELANEGAVVDRCYRLRLVEA
ncbi:unnamed protein product [Urochloa humidicola]